MITLTKQAATPRAARTLEAVELSARERDVAIHVAQGLTNAEIGSELFISPYTVQTHLTSIRHKLSARNRVEVAGWVWRAGLMC